MAAVKILKRSKQISLRLSYNALFAMRLSVGNYLYQNPGDAAMAEFYNCLPCEDVYAPGRYVLTGQKNIRFDITYLDCLIRALKLVTIGAWPGSRSVADRIERLERISPLEALGMAAGE